MKHTLPPYLWIALAYLVIAMLTVSHYGLTWDEGVQSRYGELVLRYYASRFADRSAIEFLNLQLYGPLFESSAAAVYRFFPEHEIDIRHALIAFTGFLTILGAGVACARLEGSGGLASLALLMTPQFYGHSFNNSKDIPFACAATWFFVALLSLLERKRPRDVVLLGLAGGAMLGIRVGGLLLVAIAAVIVALTRERRLLVGFTTSVVIAWIVMVAVWPWAHANPILNPLRAFQASTTFPSRYPVLFESSFVMSNELPRRYLVEMLAITTPIGVLALAIIGVVVCARRKNWPLVLWMTVPIVLFTLMRPNVYDGIRHFLFLFPAMAIAAGIACAFLAEGRNVVVLLLAALPLLSIGSMLALHPYQSTYYNALVGGTRGASGRFETDYWVSSYREAALWLREHACGGPPTRVLVAANNYSIGCLTAYLPRDSFAVQKTMSRGATLVLDDTFDYYVATTRYGLHLNYPQTRIAAVIERDGAVFTVIRGGCRPAYP